MWMKNIFRVIFARRSFRTSRMSWGIIRENIRMQSMNVKKLMLRWHWRFGILLKVNIVMIQAKFWVEILILFNFVYYNLTICSILLALPLVVFLKDSGFFVFIWLLRSPAIHFKFLDFYNIALKSYFSLLEYNEIHGWIFLQSKSFVYEFLDPSIKSCSFSKFSGKLIQKYDDEPFSCIIDKFLLWPRDFALR